MILYIYIYIYIYLRSHESLSEGEMFNVRQYKVNCVKKRSYFTVWCTWIKYSHFSKKKKKKEEEKEQNNTLL